MLLVIVYLFLAHHALVEGELLSFQDVSITPSGLSRSGADLGEDTAGGELLVKGRFEGSVDLSSLELLGDLGRLGGKIDGLSGIDGVLALEADLDSVVGLVPGLEGVGIDHDDSTLDQGLRTDQFVVGGVVQDIQDTDLAGADLGTPRKVPGVESQSPKFGVSSAATDLVDAGFTDLGRCGWSAHVVLSLLAKLRAASTGLPALVSSFACDTHCC